MAKIYVALIRKGLKTINDVPEQLREEVKKLLEEYHAVAHFAMAQQEGGEKHGCYLCGTHCQG